MTGAQQGAAERAAARGGEAMARTIRRVAEKNRKAAGFVLPFFDADPEAGDPTTMWGFNDNRLRLRKPDGTIREIVTTAPGATTSSVPLGTAADIELQQAVYAATWGKGYCQAHGAVDGEILFGYGIAPTHGLRRIMLGFDHATIAADLAGSVIRTAELSMSNADAGSTSIEVWFGVHNSSAAPAAYAPTRLQVWSDFWPTTGTGAEWRRPDGAQLIRVAEWLRDGTAKGLVIDQPDTSAAGEMFWASVRLRIEFTS